MPPRTPNGAALDAKPERRMKSIDGCNRVTHYVYSLPKRRSRYEMPRDARKRLFRIVGPDGQTCAFHDEPDMYPVMVRDRRTGRTLPIMRYGEPEYLYLCREASEGE
jgi:hypothetical protein